MSVPASSGRNFRIAPLNAARTAQRAIPTPFKAPMRARFFGGISREAWASAMRRGKSIVLNR